MISEKTKFCKLFRNNIRKEIILLELFASSSMLQVWGVVNLQKPFILICFSSDVTQTISPPTLGTVSISRCNYKGGFDSNTSIAALGALAHRLQRRTTCNT